MGNSKEYEKYFTYFIVFGFAVLAVNIYYYCFDIFSRLGWVWQPTTNIMLDLRRGGLFDHRWTTKAWALGLMAVSFFNRRSMGEKVPWTRIAAVGGAGLLVYFLPVRISAVYMLTSVAGLTMLTWTVAALGRNIMTFHEAENDPDETFAQCEKLIRTEDSVNIPTKYQYKGRLRDGWINVVNPFRATMVLGTPGSGKSYSVYGPFIEQMIHSGYCMYCYDYKFPDLTSIVYNRLLENVPHYRKMQAKARPKDKWKWKIPEFHVINFADPRYSNRINPIAAKYIREMADAIEFSETIMTNLVPGSAEKRGDFFQMSGKMYIALDMELLANYENRERGVAKGSLCTFPHLIELMAMDYKKVFAIAQTFPELEAILAPFRTALEEGAQDQLQGQIASAQIPMNMMASAGLYWVLSGEDFDLAFNDPEHPKVVCVGNDPDRQSVYGTVLALMGANTFKQINHKKRRKCAVLLDELPTIFLKGLDNLIATARSNKVAIVLGAQDKSQLVRDYGQKEAEVIFNTVGNIFAGQVNGKTAEELSKSFGKEFRRRESQTKSTDSTSVNVSSQLEEVLPVNRIETLSQGLFLGKVADNFRTPIRKKFFCGTIIIDQERQDAFEESMQPLPVMTDFGQEFRARYRDERSRQSLYWAECVDRAEKSLSGNGMLADEEDIRDEARKMFRNLSRQAKDNIYAAALEEFSKKNAQARVMENYRKIKQDILDLVRDYFPDYDPSGGEEEDTKAPARDSYKPFSDEQ